MGRDRSRRPEVLALGHTRAELAALLRALRVLGLRPRAAASTRDALAQLLRAGSLDLLVVEPTANPALAAAVLAALRAIDPYLPVVVFGRDLLPGLDGGLVHRVPDLHPCSRAGLGAVRRHATS